MAYFDEKSDNIRRLHDCMIMALAAHTDASLRWQAQQELDAWQSNVDHVSIALQLSLNDKAPETVRFFCMSTLIHQLTYNASHFSLQGIHTPLLTLLDKEMPHLLRDKWAILISRLVQRDYPHSWPDLLVTLIRAFDMDISALNALCIFRSVSDDLRTDEDLATEMKAEWLRGSEDWIPLIRERIMDWQMKGRLMNVRVAIQTLLSCVSWCPVSLMENGEWPMPALFISFISSSDEMTAQAALDALEILVSRRYKPTEKPFLLQVPIAALQQGLNQRNNPSFHFIQQCTQIMIEWGIQCIESAIESREYLNATLQWIQHPWITVSASASRFWWSLFMKLSNKDENRPTAEKQVHDKMISIVDSMMGSLVECLCQRLATPFQFRENENDFESVSSFRQLVQSLKQRHLSLLGRITQQKPEEMIQFINHAMQQSWPMEVLCSVIEVTLQNIPDSLPSVQWEVLIESVLEKCSVVQTADRWMHCLIQTASSLGKVRASLIEKLLSLLFTAMTSQDGNESSIQISKRASTLLVRIGSFDCLAPMASALLTHISSLLSLPHLREEERAYFMSFLMLLKLPEEERQRVVVAVMERLTFLFQAAMNQPVKYDISSNTLNAALISSAVVLRYVKKSDAVLVAPCIQALLPFWMELALSDVKVTTIKEKDQNMALVYATLCHSVRIHVFSAQNATTILPPVNAPLYQWHRFLTQILLPLCHETETGMEMIPLLEQSSHALMQVIQTSVTHIQSLDENDNDSDSDESEEMALLRLVMHSLLELLNLVWSDKIRNSFLSQYQLCPSVFQLTLAPVTWRDGKSLSRITSLYSSMYSKLLSNSVLQVFVVHDLLSALLVPLQDGYHQDLHATVIALISDIVAACKSDSFLIARAQDLLCSLPGVTLVLWEKWMTASGVTKQRAAMRMILKSILGKPVSQWGHVQKQNQSNVNTLQRATFLRQKRFMEMERVDEEDDSVVGLALLEA